jgi:hypothetical protein
VKLSSLTVDTLGCHILKELTLLQNKKHARGGIRETNFHSSEKENLKGDKNQEGMKDN